MKRLLPLASRLVLALNVLAVLLLAGAYLSRYISPADWALPALVGLGYPIWVLMNVGFALMWLFTSKKKRALWSAAILLLGVGVHMPFWNPLPSGSVAPASEHLDVLTYNFKLFDVYHAGKTTPTRDSILDLMAASGSDVYCLQEFYRTDRTAVFETKKAIIKATGAKYQLESTVSDVTGLQHFGVALFSKYPFAESGEVDLVSDQINRCIYADVVTPWDTVRVYSAHLASIRFQKEDYDFVSGREEYFWGGGKRLSSRLMDAYRRRATQVDIILEHVAQSPHPTILCGDFNDTPASYAYRQLADPLTDSWAETSSGLGRTYVGTFPSFRIDYVWHSEGLQAESCIVYPAEHSDHRAVQARLSKAQY